jgi:hypothetical protein
MCTDHNFNFLVIEFVATDGDPLQRLTGENSLVVFGQLLNENGLFRYNRYKDPLQRLWLRTQYKFSRDVLLQRMRAVCCWLFLAQVCIEII